MSSLRTEHEIRDQLDAVQFGFEGPIPDAVVLTLRWVLGQGADTPRDIVWAAPDDEPEFSL
jgi:hypothetical protein